MEDPPLSVAASITGILTFCATIIAFIYVRYSIISNGYAEISKIMASVKSDGALAITDPTIEEDLRPGAVQMRKLISDFRENDHTILLKLLKVHGVNISGTDSGFAVVGTEAQESYQPARTKSMMFFRALRSCATAFGKWVDWLEIFWGFWRFSATVALGGTSATLLRWYVVREEVMDMVERRNLLRSQIQYQQMALLHMDLREIKSELSRWKSEN
ncbi:hypothetical protein B0H63DRAFT_488777 [Podospora didyma]|uniref:Uncharacterized protein n=1 Tax=Podospora didyma TaxID=330526 RepID=A0AAE0N3B2_9PEZI|nr:hypothetical protein B0H63DRAFT_488777 [Podospora didyma]